MSDAKKRRLDPARTKPRPVCSYGAHCYRKNPEHFLEYDHPGVAPSSSSTSSSSKYQASSSSSSSSSSASKDRACVSPPSSPASPPLSPPPPPLPIPKPKKPSVAQMAPPPSKPAPISSSFPSSSSPSSPATVAAAVKKLPPCPYGAEVPPLTEEIESAPAGENNSRRPNFSSKGCYRKSLIHFADYYHPTAVSSSSSLAPPPSTGYSDTSNRSRSSRLLSDPDEDDAAYISDDDCHGFRGSNQKQRQKQPSPVQKKPIGTAAAPLKPSLSLQAPLPKPSPSPSLPSPAVSKPDKDKLSTLTNTDRDRRQSKGSHSPSATTETSISTRTSCSSSNTSSISKPPITEDVKKRKNPALYGDSDDEDMVPGSAGRSSSGNTNTNNTNNNNGPRRNNNNRHGAVVRDALDAIDLDATQIIEALDDDEDDDAEDIQDETEAGAARGSSSNQSKGAMNGHQEASSAGMMIDMQELAEEEDALAAVARAIEMEQKQKAAVVAAAMAKERGERERETERIQKEKETKDADERDRIRRDKEKRQKDEKERIQKEKEKKEKEERERLQQEKERKDKEERERILEEREQERLRLEKEKEKEKVKEQERIHREKEQERKRMDKENEERETEKARVLAAEQEAAWTAKEEERIAREEEKDRKEREERERREAEAAREEKADVAKPKKEDEIQKKTKKKATAATTTKQEEPIHEDMDDEVEGHPADPTPRKPPLLQRSYSIMTEEERKQLIMEAFEAKRKLQQQEAELAELKQVREQLQSGQLYVDGEVEALKNDAVKCFELLAERTHEGLLSASQMHFRLAESQFYRLMETGEKYRIQKVEYVVAPKLVHAFNKARAELVEMYKNTKDGCVFTKPVLGFHGTAQKNITPICETGFRLPGQDGHDHSTDSGWYGKGVYFSEYPAYAMAYIEDATKLLLCQVLLGRVYKCKKLMHGAAKQAGYDSHTSPDGKELIVFNPVHILPSYVVHYEAVTDKHQMFEYRKPEPKTKKKAFKKKSNGADDDSDVADNENSDKDDEEENDDEDVMPAEACQSALALVGLGSSLSTCAFVLSGKFHCSQSQMAALIQDHAGTVVPAVTAARIKGFGSQLFVVLSSNAPLSSKKVSDAQKLGITDTIVTERFVYDSVLKGRLLKVDNYKVIL